MKTKIKRQEETTKLLPIISILTHALRLQSCSPRMEIATHERKKNPAGHIGNNNASRKPLDGNKHKQIWNPQCQTVCTLPKDVDRAHAVSFINFHFRSDCGYLHIPSYFFLMVLKRYRSFVMYGRCAAFRYKAIHLAEMKQKQKQNKKRYLAKIPACVYTHKQYFNPHIFIGSVISFRCMRFDHMPTSFQCILSIWP